MPLVPTVIVLLAPVEVDASTRCAPESPVTTVALMPGLSDAELIADAMSASLLLEPESETFICLLPRLSVSVPVPRFAIGSIVPEVIFCALATLVTAI